MKKPRKNRKPTAKPPYPDLRKDLHRALTALAAALDALEDIKKHPYR